MEELLNTYPEKKVKDIAKEVQYVNGPPKVLNCCSSPWATIGGGAVTEGNKWIVLTVTLPSQRGDFISNMTPPRVEK